MDKPSVFFDRDQEWSALAAFAMDPTPGATLGVVSGRRRQGKSFLLQALCQEAGGFYFAATEGTEAAALRELSAAYAAHARIPAATFANWDQAIDALLALGRDRSVPVVIDEFPYLVAGSPALPSIVQRAIGPLRKERMESRARLILCGSSMSFMGKLLSGNAPLRGRAGLELLIRPFNYQLSAQFWGLDSSTQSDMRLALLVHSIVGGTPAYRREFIRSDTPENMADFDDWVCRTVLNPATPLFREARYLLAEEPGIRDAALYNSVLAAVADGNSTRSGIANYIARPAADIGHPLTVLEDAGLLRRDKDLLRTAKSVYRIAEPLITFYHAVMRPLWSVLESGLLSPERTKAAWNASQIRFISKVVGPHFEEVCRTWAEFSDPHQFAALVSDGQSDLLPAVEVGTAVVNDAATRALHEIDVLVLAPADGKKRRVLSIGEAKWGTRMGITHLQRLQRIQALLVARNDVDAHDAIPTCYSAAGFTDQLQELADQGRVLLVTADDLYRPWQ